MVSFYYELCCIFRRVDGLLLYNNYSSWREYMYPIEYGVPITHLVIPYLSYHFCTLCPTDPSRQLCCLVCRKLEDGVYSMWGLVVSA